MPKFQVVYEGGTSVVAAVSVEGASFYPESQCPFPMGKVLAFWQLEKEETL